MTPNSFALSPSARPLTRLAPELPEKSLWREVFELGLEVVSPNTLKALQVSESLAESPNLSAEARSIMRGVSTFIIIDGAFKLADAITTDE